MYPFSSKCCSHPGCRIILSRVITLRFVVMSPWVPLGCDSVSDFPGFWWSWPFWGVLVKHLAGCPSLGIFLFFSWSYWAYKLWGEEDRMGKVLFSSHRGYTLPVRLDTVDANLDSCLGYPVSSFSAINVFPHPFPHCPLWKDILWAAHT